MTLKSLYALFENSIPIFVAFFLFMIVMMVVNRTTRLGVIARGTLKEIIRQPAFILVILGAAFLIFLNYIVPFFAFKDETKMYVDCCLSTILVAGLLITIWSASTSVSEEVESKTAMTLLSKPLMRWEFIVGKYLGIVQAAFLQIALLAIFFVPATYMKYGYDQKEAGEQKLAVFEWVTFTDLGQQVWFFQPDRLTAAVNVVPGLALVFLQIIVLAAVAVMLSTRLPMLVTVVTCFAIFVVGHLTPQLVQSGDQLVFVQFIGQLFASILPGLESFDISAAVATGKQIPPSYIGTTALYSVGYIGIMMLLSFILFEDHDLA